MNVELKSGGFVEIFLKLVRFLDILSYSAWVDNTPFPTLEEKQWLILWKAPKRRSLEWKTWCMVKNGGKELYVLRTGGLNESLHTEYFPTGLLEPWYSNPPGRTLKETSLETLTSLRIHL